MRETMAQQTHDVVVDQTPLHVYMGMILDRLREGSPAAVRGLFTPPHTRGRLVGLFLGVLELTKQRRILPEQGEPFTEIWVACGRNHRRPRKPRRARNDRPRTPGFLLQYPGARCGVRRAGAAKCRRSR